MKESTKIYNILDDDKFTRKIKKMSKKRIIEWAIIMRDELNSRKNK